ncbi:unnamed protein product [Tilletia controversa]|uniref:Transcription factor spt8 beta-propeller domain-containing protein n=3 Tax=Tilletia TaxID=13289 RepID=A0A8X7SWM6_9BASI|nr:hypothetical protein CF336_g4290 [Tilletia laevis]KAE8197441.1 hypothetical protein CF328_g3845 [Tilletia controversa]KAE8257027.1 hypothetical protein A4X03_0g4816 [Tilletia caries]KAE8202359.1 hypothetical protein CF335_g3449 [Tilletia laevis]KAE8247414.1 hypothetical protein A4X06_0g4473 [Tilletia controversa]
MAWSTARAKPGNRGRRILEDEYDDEDEDGAVSDPPEDNDEDDDEDDDDDPDGDGDPEGDGDVEMDSPDDGADDDTRADDDEDQDFDEEDEDADGEADEDAEGDSDDDGDGDEDDDDGDGEDDDIDADGDEEEVDPEADGDGDDDDDDDDEDEDADGDPDDAPTPATTKAGTPAAARSENLLATPSKFGQSRFQQGPTSSVADDTPSRPSARRRLDEDYDDDEDEDEDEDTEPPRKHPPMPSKPVRYSKYAPETYTERTKVRLEAVRPSDDVFQTNSYSIDPSAAAPHVAHVHAFAMSADSTVLLTGGSDGYVRSYDLYKTMNGRQMLTQSVRHAYVEGVVRAGVMTHFWGNDEIPRKMNPALVEDELPVSAVHSLACQRDALWGLSGTESGNINLFTIRHASGKIQHVLRKHKAPVSVMALADSDRTLISGSWDRNVHQWDLNTGKVVRSYPGHAGQVSSLSFRPIQNGSRHKRRRTSNPTNEEGTGDSGTLLDDPNTQIAISIRSPESRIQKDHEMDVDFSASTAAKPTEEGNADEGKTSQSTSTEEPTKGESAPQPPPPPAPPDDKEQRDRQVSSSGLGLSLHAAVADQSKPDAAKTGDSSKAALNAADEDNDSLFGGSDEEAAGENTTSSKPGASGTALGGAAGPEPNGGTDANAEADADADGDGDADGSADAEGDADGDDDRDGDADADDDDQPLFAIALRERAAGVGTPCMPSTNLPVLARTQSSSTLYNANSPGFYTGSGGSLVLPSNGTPAAASSPMPVALGGLTPALPSSQPLPTMSANIPDLAAPQPPPKPRTQTSHLPKPAFGPASTVRGFSDDVSTFSDDILLSTTLAGQVMLWDRRVKSTSGPVGVLANGHSHINSNNVLDISGPHAHMNGAVNGSHGLQRTLSGLSGHFGFEAPTASSFSSSSSNPYENGRGVHALALPDKTPPWCATACWSAFGDRIYVGRRNETVDEWDLRMVGGSRDEVDDSKHNPRFVRSLKLPMGSGSVSALCAMPNGRHIVCGSFDNVRLWDTEATVATTPFRIVAGHHGGFVSQMGIDATARFLLVASGDRGWLSTSTEALLIHEIQAQ